ncbi:MAG: hypothetical protein WA094_04690 [Candidatus Desulfobacillus denitrificans]
MNSFLPTTAPTVRRFGGAVALRTGRPCLNGSAILVSSGDAR